MCRRRAILGGALPIIQAVENPARKRLMIAQRGRGLRSYDMGS
jgi:hypothetical protein